MYLEIYAIYTVAFRTEGGWGEVIGGGFNDFDCKYLKTKTFLGEMLYKLLVLVYCGL